jgi:hypothetical protein
MSEDQWLWLTSVETIESAKERVASAIEAQMRSAGT